MKELKGHNESLHNRSLMHGFWDTYSEFSGTQPDAREGATMNQLNGVLYIFGGFSRVMFNDLKILSLESLKWKSFSDEKDKVWPKVRNNHTMAVFGDSLVLFGG